MEGDTELKLQKASSDLIAEFERSLKRYLQSELLVRHSKTSDLVKLLEPFQEWPQLLDPHLRRLVPPLVSKFLVYLEGHVVQYQTHNAHGPEDDIPLPRGISRILYTFCKIRGYKVISHFLNNEPRYLEPMLSAYHMWNMFGRAHSGQLSQRAGTTWEEAYIMLLWISHLILTPFDLASISSISRSSTKTLHIDLPIEMPSSAKHATSIAIRSLSVASKEREAAAVLLVRIALRPDMRPFDLLKITMKWALASLEQETDETGKRSIYAHIGVLSFLAGLFTSADSKTIDQYLLVIFRSIQAIVAQGSENSKSIYSSALARKLIIKIFRAITMHTLRDRLEEPSQTQLSSEENLEEVIDHVLTTLADKDTPVRYAASKALSIITAKLDSALAGDVVEALVGNLEENVLWEDAATGQMIASYDLQESQSEYLKSNLTGVNPLRWHGLVLALSQLLYRRSPPREKLPTVLNLLIMALSFEQRSAVGASIGTNVRDAACFGIWALARRYTTRELSAIDTSHIRSASGQEQSISVLQILANEIVVVACLDSSGNIRRGASAALQELIGRHPDTIEQGISVVQVVDYHAIALRSKALTEVTLGASDLSRLYWRVLFDGLLGARGVGSVDAPSRRDAAIAIGELARKSPNESLQKVRACLRSTTHRQPEKRQSLILSLAAIIAVLGSLSVNEAACSVPSLNTMSSLFEDIRVTGKDLTTATLRPHFTAEAICRLISISGSVTRSSSLIADILRPTFHASLDESMELLRLALGRTEDVVVDAASAAAKELLRFVDFSKREELIASWISTISNRKSRAKPYGMIAALGTAYEQLEPSDEIAKRILDSLLGQLEPSLEIETRVWSMKSLKPCIDTTKGAMNTWVIQAIARGLDDYTTDRRGDIGSSSVWKPSMLRA